eukprot:1487021-Pyramimonas_sp.AAC.1
MASSSDHSMYCTILCRTVPWCTVLYRTVRCVVYCAVLYRTCAAPAVPEYLARLELGVQLVEERRL